MDKQRPAPSLVFDHVGIVAADADKGCLDLARSLGATEATRRFDDPGLTVSVRFLRDPSGMVYEIIAPLGENSVVSETLKKQANLLNQLAYKTKNFLEDVKILRQQGFFPLGDAKPALAFSGAQVLFLLSPMGYIVELIEETNTAHQFHPLAL